jgi:hypothetical protein
MPARQAAPCLKCGEMIEISEAAFVIDIRLRVVGIAGISESARSSQASVSCCITCADLIARGDEPNPRNRPLDHVVYELVQGLVTDDPMYAFLSWIEFRKAKGLPSPMLSDPKTLRVWNEFRKTLALPPVLDSDGEGDREGKTALVKVAG